MEEFSSRQFRSWASSWRSLPANVLFGRGLILLIVFSFTVLTVLSVIDAIGWINKPFPGFLINGRKVVVDYGQYYWPGKSAGLRYPDKLLEADGAPVISDSDLEKIIKGKPLGTPISYTFDREGQLMTVSIPTMRFSMVDFVATFGIEFLAACLYLTLGVVVFILKPDTHVSWAHFSACASVAFYVMCGFDVVTTHRRIPFYNAVNCWVPPAFVHLGMLFPYRWKIVERWPVIVAIPYVLSGLALMPILLYYPGPRFVQVHQFIYLFTMIGAVTLVASALTAFLRGESVLARQRAKVVLFGAAFAFPLPTLLYIFPFIGILTQLGTFNSNFLVLALLIFPSSVAYAISKHNLFDVDTYIKRTVGYVLMTGIVAGGYFVFQTAVKTTILDPLVGTSSDKLYPFLFALLTVFAFNPVSLKVQQTVDRLFYRKQYDYKTTVATLSDSLTALADVGGFFEKVIHTIQKDLFVDRAGIIIVDERQKSSQCIFRGPKFGKEPTEGEERDACLSPDDALLSLLAHERKLITKYDLAEAPRYSGVRETCGRRMEELGSSLVLPLYYREQFAGALALGYKKSGHFYTREDIDLLKTVSSMTSTAIEQSREKGQKATLMQLFSKHVSPQVAESLWEQREQFLEGGRPKSQSMIVTAMFTDLQGFSTLSEKQSPEVLMGWLNTYLEMMTNTVMEYGGVVDDFFGDGVKINFGVPVPREHDDDIRSDAIHAVRCALAMRDRMIALNRRMSTDGQHTLRMRIGIHTGAVVAGSLGSAERMKYTTIGDTVNTAARLESFDKDLTIPELKQSPCRILISESTLQHIKGFFNTKKVGELSLKGKMERIEAHCVLSAGADIEAAQDETQEKVRLND
jgi:class 3 adenylate cyclase